MIDLTTVVVAAVSAMSGTGLTAFFTWWGNHESTGAALEKERLNATRQELSDLRLEVKALRAELHAVEARSRTDRMAAMLSADHISRLVAHIDAGDPPPAPPLPVELADYMRTMWDDPQGAHSTEGGRAPPTA